MRSWSIYEPDAKYRAGREPTPLPYLRIWTARKEVEFQDSAIKRVGGHELLGIKVEILKLTARQAFLRGYLLNHLQQPASCTEIAEDSAG